MDPQMGGAFSEVFWPHSEASVECSPLFPNQFFRERTAALSLRRMLDW